MWEVNPESKSKLLALQKRSGNDRCCDCGTPSPQWASPKFGTFICLTCAGLHRGLGVHISFVRSITMDAFKGTELARMEMGGNEAWREFWEATEKGKLWDAVELQEKYGGAAGEEWKERLGCKVEGKDFVGMPRRPEPLKKTFDGIADSDGPGRRAASPAGGALGRTDSRKAQNEKFFARLGNANADRPAHLAPSQGGKYGGFGGGSSVSAESAGAAREPGDGGIPGVEEFQKDPVAALTKGFGWFTTTVGKGAKTVNEGWIQPTAQKIASADLPTQARLTAASVAQNITSSTKGAAEQLNKFIDEGVGSSTSSRTRGAPSRTVEPERRDFWDSFGAPVEEEKKAGSSSKTSAIGTAAVRKKEEGMTSVMGQKEGWDAW